MIEAFRSIDVGVRAVEHDLQLVIGEYGALVPYLPMNMAR